MSKPEVLGQGKLSTASDANAPLLVVFGGITVGGSPSGEYMWPYMSGILDRFQIFVARDNAVNGTSSYSSLMGGLKVKAITPSRQILYLFSGGYAPGMDLLGGSGAPTFSQIFLVDIWMGSSKVADFYKNLADVSATNMRYVYTAFGANNNGARDYIADKLGPRATLIKGGGMATHMSTNTTAVSSL